MPWPNARCRFWPRSMSNSAGRWNWSSSRLAEPIQATIGAPLARLEARIALGALLSRLPGLSLVPGAHLERMESTIIYGLKAIPVRWQPA